MGGRKNDITTQPGFDDIDVEYHLQWKENRLRYLSWLRGYKEEHNIPDNFQVLVDDEGFHPISTSDWEIPLEKCYNLQKWK